MVPPGGNPKSDPSTLSPVGGKVCDPPSGCPDCIRASALGAELTDEELSTLCGTIDVRRVPKGEVLISEGDRDDRLYAVASGRIEIYRVGAAGREITLKSVGPGGITGELGFIESLPRTANVRAGEESCIVSLHRDQLESLLPDHPWLVYKILRSVIRSAHGTVGNLDTAYADFMRYITG